MGHIGENGLLAMHSKGMVEGLPDCSFEVDFYEHGVYGKHCLVSFPCNATRNKGILELIHSYVFGPVSVPSLGGYQYYMSFIVDFSIMTWLSFLRNKSEGFKKFIEFKILIEN